MTMREDTSSNILLSIFLEMSGLHIPSNILDQKFFQKLEAALKSGSTILVHTLKNISINIENYLNFDSIIELSDLMQESSSIIDKNIRISSEDEKIISILTGKERLIEFLEISGPIIDNFEIIQCMGGEDINISDDKRRIILLYCYVGLYESILHLVDRALNYRLLDKDLKTEIKKTKEIRRFLKINRKDVHNHASVGLINSVFCQILAYP